MRNERANAPEPIRTGRTARHPACGGVGRRAAVRQMPNLQHGAAQNNGAGTFPRGMRLNRPSRVKRPAPSGNFPEKPKPDGRIRPGFSAPGCACSTQRTTEPGTDHRAEFADADSSLTTRFILPLYPHRPEQGEEPVAFGDPSPHPSTAGPDRRSRRPRRDEQFSPDT